MAVRPGPRNTITDVPGIRVGQAEDRAMVTGTTVVLAERAAVAAVTVTGGAPGASGTAILHPASVMTKVDAVALSGGSSFGLEATGGASDWLRHEGRGFSMGTARVPIVPGAIIFDLLTGPEPAWDRPPWWALGRTATERAAGEGGLEVALGNAGAGLGARAGNIKGGTGTASACTAALTVGALTVANPVGRVLIPGSRAFWAHPFERDGEFGAVAPPPTPVADLDYPFEDFSAGENTSLAVVATDLALDRDQCLRVAVMAQDGLARAIRPVHSPLDGDTIFVLATGARPLANPIAETARAGMLAADCVARAIARGVYEAESIAGVPAWRDLGPDGEVPA